MPQHLNPPGGGDQQAQQHGDGGGFPRPIAAQQAHGAAGRHHNIQPIYREHLAIAFGQSGHTNGIHAPALVGAARAAKSLRRLRRQLGSRAGVPRPAAVISAP